MCGKIQSVKKRISYISGGKGKRSINHIIIYMHYIPGVSIACIFVCFVLFCFVYALCVGLSRVDNGTAGGFNNDGGGPQQSGSVSLTLSAADATPAGSPDPSSLTVLQPANNNQNNGTVYAAAAPTMLPGFTTHYATTGESTIIQGTRETGLYHRVI